MAALLARANAKASESNLGPRWRAVIADRCIADRWPDAVIDCYTRATAIDEMRECRRQLPTVQQDVFERDELDLMGGSEAPRFRAP